MRGAFDSKKWYVIILNISKITPKWRKNMHKFLKLFLLFSVSMANCNNNLELGNKISEPAQNLSVFQKAFQKAKTLCKETGEWISENPVVTLGIAALLMFVISQRIDMNEQKIKYYELGNKFYEYSSKIAVRDAETILDLNAISKALDEKDNLIISLRQRLADVPDMAWWRLSEQDALKAVLAKQQQEFFEPRYD